LFNKISNVPFLNRRCVARRICAYSCIVYYKNTLLLAPFIIARAHFDIYVRKFTLLSSTVAQSKTTSGTYEAVVLANEISCVIELTDGEWALGRVINCFFSTSSIAAHSFEDSVMYRTARNRYCCYRED
jgi:hypothetical protein